MKEYLLFDLDGTLTDSGPGITRSVQYALKAFGIDEPDLKKLECFVGPPLRESFRNFYGLDGETAEAVVQKYRERYAETGIYENEVYDGIPRMLRRLKKSGFHLAVASSKPQEYVERVLTHFGLKDYFEVVVGGTMDGKGDGKKDIIEKVLGAFKAGKTPDRENVYMIGDTAYDIKGAKEAGVESVGVAFGFGSMEDLSGAGADYIVQSVWELQDFLMREIRAGESREILIKRGKWVFLCLFLFEVLRIAGWKKAELSPNEAAAAGAVFYCAAGLAIYPAAKRMIEEARIDRRLQNLMPISAVSYAVLFLAGIMAVVGLNLLFALSGLTNFSQGFKQANEVIAEVSLGIGILCYGILSPIAEELLFRGILYNYFRRFCAAIVSAVISAVLFGIWHGNIVQGIYACLMGFFIAYAYEYFGSFRIPVILHMIFNITALLLPLLGLGKERVNDLLVCAASLLCAAAGILSLHKRKKRVF